jgi:hypothetical protein
MRGRLSGKQTISASILGRALALRKNRLLLGSGKLAVPRGISGNVAIFFFF